MYPWADLGACGVLRFGYKTSGCQGDFSRTMHARPGLILVLAAAHGFVHTANHRHSSALLGWRYSIEECDVDDECGAGQLDVRQLGYNSGLGAWVYSKVKLPKVLLRLLVIAAPSSPTF